MGRMSKLQKEMLDNIEESEEVIEVPPYREEATITKFEAHDDTPPPKNDWDTRSMGMQFEHKLMSMKNAIKILPPNMIKNGRHTRENVQAIVGFIVSEEMMDEVYKDFSHS